MQSFPGIPRIRIRLRTRIDALSITDGRCSLVGTWDTVPNGSDKDAAFSFDSAGRWVAGALGANLCSSHSMHGTYELSPGNFELVTVAGMGACAFWFAGGFNASFDEECSTLSLDVVWDNCTGGRGYLNEPSVLRRHR